jgi:ribonuclease P protein component
LNTKNTFTKAERISIQREIDLLFNEASSFTAYPLRVLVVEQQPASGAPVSVLVSVPKKRLKRAVHRNRVKRLIRETYRLNKSLLWNELNPPDKGLLVAFIYLGNTVCAYKAVETGMKKALQTLSEKFQ